MSLAKKHDRQTSEHSAQVPPLPEGFSAGEKCPTQLGQGGGGVKLQWEVRASNAYEQIELAWHRVLTCTMTKQAFVDQMTVHVHQ